MTEFSAAVLKWIRKIPPGKVATYGQIAALAGKSQGARGVAWLLNSSSKAHRLPWHRVINSQYRISFAPGSAAFRKQKALLTGEGVGFDNSGRVRTQHRWTKRPARPRKSSRQKNPRMFA